MKSARTYLNKTLYGVGFVDNSENEPAYVSEILRTNMI